MSYTMQTSANVPSAKIPHLHLHWAIRGDVCQMYARIQRLRRNRLIFVPRRMPRICQFFGSRYSQVKLEGPLHIPCIYQSVLVWDLLAYARYVMLVYYVGAYAWYMSLHQNRN